MAARIHVLSASVGAGHLRAAQAVALALQQLDPSAVVKNIDVMEMSGRVFRQLYAKSYLDFVNKAPHLLGYLYDMADRPRSGGAKGLTDKFKLAVQKFNMRPFRKFLDEEPADLIINTHFLPAEIISSLKAKGQFAGPHVTVTTDFETHRFWVNQPCEHYFTATEEGAAYLAHWGVPAGDITTVGIPIHPVFAKPKDRGECLKKHGLTGKKPVLLQLAGGFGVGPIEQIYRGLLAIEVPCEIIVVTGKNEEARAQLAAVKPPERHKVIVMGFTTEIDELMQIADLVVSKPGGLTTSETLARGAAMAVVNPIPGQESRNSDYLLENGAAVKINNIPTMPGKLAALLADKPRLAQLKANAAKLGRPQAAFEVARRALEWAKRKR